MSPGSSASRPADTTGTLLLVHRLGPAQEPAVRRALAAGHDVVALASDDERQRVRVLGSAALPGFEDGAFVPGSFDLVEAAVEELGARRPRVLGALVQLTGSSNVDRYLCRALLREAGALLGLALLVASPELAAYERVVVEQHWPNGPDLAILADVAIRRQTPLPPPVENALGRLSFQAEEEPPLLRRLRGAAHAVREFAALWRETLAFQRLAAPRLPRRPLLIRSYGEDWGLDRGGQPRLRNLDFVVDGMVIRPDEVSVWMEEGVPPDRGRRLEERGYSAISRADVGFGPIALLARVLPSLLRASLLFARLARAERWWYEPTRRLLFETIFWRELAQLARPRVFLALNDIHPAGVGRTFALRREGCLTVEYEFSSHWLTDESGWVPDYVYGFTVVDAMVSWGPLHSEHFRNHRGSIGDFWEVGCLWSEHARLVKEDDSLGYREALDLPLEAYDRVVGVFDTSTASFFGYDDMAAFYAGVVFAAARLPRVLFLCKPKRPLESVYANATTGRELEATLAAAPNVAILDQFFETAAVVGLCDLSVNACFTSPAIETIGVGRPAVYFDPTNLFPRSFLRQIPDFVAASDAELVETIEALLGAEPDSRLRNLRERFSGLEGHFDGLAITRMRERLRAAIDRP